MKNYFAKIKQYKIKYCIEIILDYKVEPIIAKIFKMIFLAVPAKNVIIFSSHNDFDMNAGTLYDYLIANKVNHKYQLIWFVNKIHKNKLPDNVCQLLEKGIGIKKYYYHSVAKYIFYDDIIIEKWRNSQTVIYLGHATRAMKNCRGLVTQPNSVDYVCSSSEFNDELMSEIYECNPSKMLHTGFPVTDLLFTEWNELQKLGIMVSYKKVIIWMPTFRKSGFSKARDDSEAVTETGLPLIETSQQYDSLNTFLQKEAVLLIIKFHPAQDIGTIGVSDSSNIMLLSPDRVKQANIDTYKLLTQMDALISDYSSISFDYLLLDRPIAYILSDFESYKLGFAVSNPNDYMPGAYIFNYQDFMDFIMSVINEWDKLKEKRNDLRQKVAKYNNGNCCEQIAQYFHLISFEDSPKEQTKNSCPEKKD